MVRRVCLAALIALATFAFVDATAGPVGAAPGAPDPSFGIDGKVITPAGEATGYFQDVVVQSDGKIVAFGARDSLTPEAVFARYSANGMLDPTFGTNGIVDLWIGPPGVGETPLALLRQPDGKLLGVASFTNGNTSTTGLVRLNLDGTVDNTFGLFGRVWNTQLSTGRNAALLSDGHIALVGQAMVGLDLFHGAVARLDANGVPDATFGTGGLAAGFGGAFPTDAVGVVEQGTDLVVAGTLFAGAHRDFALTRINSSGEVDTTFGLNGLTVIGQGRDDTGLDVAGASDGKIVMLGSRRYNKTELRRYTSDGQLDPSFGQGGGLTIVMTDPGEPFFSESASSVAVQPDDKIVIAGTQGENFVVKRYLPSGAPDPGFGCLGSLEADFGGSDTAHRVRLQPDGRILTVGDTRARTEDQNPGDFALARFTPAGAGSGVCGYALDAAAEVIQFGTGILPPAPAPVGVPDWLGYDNVRGIAVSPDVGGVLLDSIGGIHPFALAGAIGPPVVGSYGTIRQPGFARGIALLPDGTGGYLLDGFGGMHPFGINDHAKPPAVASPSWKWDIARGVALLPDGSGGYIVDGYGGLHAFAIGNHARSAMARGAYWKGWDIARSVAIPPTGTGGDVLDGWGGVHRFAIGTHAAPPAFSIIAISYSKDKDFWRGLALLP